MKHLIAFFLCCLVVFSASAQNKHEYLGVITLQDSSFISYKITFTEDNGIIHGYSLTDLSGEHETKSMITGTYDQKEKSLLFKESGIVYTKSPITREDFCYVHFNGKLARLNDKRKISGVFTGKYADGAICINGKIDMKSLSKIEKRAAKLDKAVDKSILIAKEKKEMVNLQRTLDTLTTNFIRANETVQIFTNDNQLTLTIVDAGQADGDRISVYVDGKSLLKDVKVGSQATSYKLNFTGESILVKIEATSAGTIGSNTVQIDIKDSINTVESITNMKAGESALYKIYKR